MRQNPFIWIVIVSLILAALRTSGVIDWHWCVILFGPPFAYLIVLCSAILLLSLGALAIAVMFAAFHTLFRRA